MPVRDGEQSPGLSRRAFVGGLAAVAVAGFDPASRRWVTRAEAAGGCAPFVDAPPLDGELLLDLPSRQADRGDQGNIVERVPAAVLRPGSVADVQAMVRYAARCGIQTAARGNHHTTHGQGLTDGLLVEMRALRTIHSVSAAGADVDAGVLWSELTEVAFAKGLRRPGLTGYTELTIGGVLAVGGVTMCSRVGGVVDTVRELDVVTGDGRLITCSETQRRDLFDAVLAGLGQYGIVVRARVDLVPAQARTRTFLLTYESADDFWSDWLVLLERGELDECYQLGFPPGDHQPSLQLWATTYYDPPMAPDPTRLLRGLRHPPVAPVLDQGYVEWTRSVDAQVQAYQAAGWDQVVKPWYDVFLPQSLARGHIDDVLAELEPDDLGPGAVVLIFPLERSRLRRPGFRMPPPDGGRWVFLFDVLTCGTKPGPDPEFAQRKLARNRRWFDQAATLGATRYPIGALEFGPADWARHYGDTWPDVQKRKRHYDPARILTPGAGIFG